MRSKIRKTLEEFSGFEVGMVGMVRIMYVKVSCTIQQLRFNQIILSHPSSQIECTKVGSRALSIQGMELFQPFVKKSIIAMIMTIIPNFEFLSFDIIVCMRRSI
ncbi:MAG: hypothetical protein WAM42_10845 [Candidatus Nitrosopolaris sp.]